MKGVFRKNTRLKESILYLIDPRFEFCNIVNDDCDLGFESEQIPQSEPFCLSDCLGCFYPDFSRLVLTAVTGATILLFCSSVFVAIFNSRPMPHSGPTRLNCLA